MGPSLRKLFKKESSTEEEIKQLVEGDEQVGELDENQRDMIYNIFEFDDLNAGDIMTHRTDIDAVDINDSIEDVVNISIKEGRSRIPVYKDDLDNICGIIYVKDLLKFVGEKITDDEGNEIVSIMFEMKNEADKTATKHKNEDFLKELDKDRKEKKCEYAVLVSLLEADNDYYNDGIVDVSHLYDKMYVIRPQFFIPMITLIRNLANKSLEYKKELDVIKNQNIDITHFEENINTFKEGFGRNYRLAAERFQKAIEEIDKTIDHLQKTKEHLLKTNDNLRLANNKAEDLTIKRLTHNNPTMSKMFEELEKDNLVEE